MWMIRRGPEPLLDCHTLDTIDINHVSCGTVHVFAIVCYSTTTQRASVYMFGLLFSHLEDLGATELAQLLALLTALLGDGWAAHIEYVDTWWEKMIVSIAPATPARLHSVIQQLVDDTETRTRLLPAPTSMRMLVDKLLDMLAD